MGPRRCRVCWVRRCTWGRTRGRCMRSIRRRVPSSGRRRWERRSARRRRWPTARCSSRRLTVDWWRWTRPQEGGRGRRRRVWSSASSRRWQVAWCSPVRTTVHCMRSRPPAADRQPVSPVNRQHRQLGSQRRPRGQRRPALRRHRRRSGHRLRPPLTGPVPDAGARTCHPTVSHPSRAARVRRWRLSGSLVVRRAASW
jgi:hypothetical protein